MATRRSWAPVNRGPQESGGQSSEGPVNSPEGHGQSQASPLEVQNSTGTEDVENEDEAAPIDSWAVWNARSSGSSEQQQQYGAGPIRSNSSGWDDSDWWNQYGSDSRRSGWQDSGWDRAQNAGWLSDHQMRSFNVADVRFTTAMNNGRWAGSYDEVAFPYADGEWSDERWASREVKTNEVPIPEFSGEGNEQEVGKSARSYVRKVQVWLRCTRMPPAQRALAPYNSLTDRAWAYAEELDMDILASENGVSYYLEWIQTRFMEVEMTKISQMMNDLFRKCKRRPEQSVREFNVEFERMVLRLREVRCELPPLVKAWLYVDKLRLSEPEELALLASVGNEYDVRKLQQAAMIQDRSLRHGGGNGDSGGGRPRWQNKWGKQSVHMTTHDEEVWSSDDEPNEDDDDDRNLVEEDVAEAAHTAYMAYQGAKAKYREALKGRGVDLEEVKRRSEERLKAAKARSFCSACKRRGHWHRDPECPLRNGKRENSATPQTNQVNMVRNVQSSCVASGPVNFEDKDNDKMLAILDTACTKSVAGYQWFQKFYEMADNLGIPWHAVDEVDQFQFGASRIYSSSFAVCGWFAIQGKWFMVKVAIVPCPVPLLFSRPVLSKLGVQYDLAAQQVSLKALNVDGLNTATSDTGHPALPVSQFPEDAPPGGFPLDFDDVWVPERVYMVAAAGLSRVSDFCSSKESFEKNIFYPKKVPLEVLNMLNSDDTVGAAAFFSWWSHANQSKDFWVETEKEMIRVHVVPRRFLFDPSKWKTTQSSLRHSLLSCLSGERRSEMIPVLSDEVVVKVHHDKKFDVQLEPEEEIGLWIGRSRFTKLEPSTSGRDPSIAVPLSHASLDLGLSMENEQRAAAERADQESSASPLLLDGSGIAQHGDGNQASQSAPFSEGSRRHEGLDKVHPGRVDQPSPSVEHHPATKAYQGLADPGSAGIQSNSGGDHCPFWQVQGVALSRSTSGLPAVGGQRMRGQPELPPRSGETGNLGEVRAGAPEGEAPYQGPVSGSGSYGKDSSAVGSRVAGGDGLGFVLEPSEQFCSSTPPHAPLAGDECKRGGCGGGSQRDRRDQDVGDTPGDLEGTPSPGREDDQCGRGRLNHGLASGCHAYMIDKGKVFAGVFDKIKYKIYELSGSESDDHKTPLGTDISKGNKPWSVEYELRGAETDSEEEFDFDMGDQTKELTGENNGRMSDILSPREKAKQGMRARKKMNMATSKKLKSNMVFLCTLFTSCLGAMSSFAGEVIGEPMADVRAVFTSSSQLQPGGNREVDCLELFAGKARISEAFAKKHRGVLHPRDLLYGHDFRHEETQNEILGEIATHCPGLVWMAPPCTVWGNFSRLNYGDQERRRLRRREMKLIKFADEVMQLQVQLGGQFVVENPRGSDIWRTPDFQDWISSGRAQIAKADLCSYGMKNISGDFPLLKPLSLLCSNEVFAQHIQRLCDGGHEHMPIQGANTAHSAIYPTAFANAVLKSCDKSQQHHVAFPTASTSSTALPLQAQETVDPEPYGAKAISFKGKVNPTIAAALRRVHQNLGHPPNRELIKHLRIGGPHNPSCTRLNSWSVGHVRRAARQSHTESAPR